MLSSFVIQFDDDERESERETEQSTTEATPNATNVASAAADSITTGSVVEYYDDSNAVQPFVDQAEYKSSTFHTASGSYIPTNVDDEIFRRSYYTLQSIPPTAANAKVLSSSKRPYNSIQPTSIPATHHQKTITTNSAFINDPANNAFEGPWRDRRNAAQRSGPELTEELRLRIEENRINHAKKHKKDLLTTSGDAENIGETTQLRSHPKAAGTEIEEKSVFHGKELYDYQHRSYLHPPPSIVSLEPPERCFAPKRCIHTWKGHKQGVNAIRFFPSTYHLLLSASSDKSMKLWRVGGDYACLRTFYGHAEAVRDICFSANGNTFISCSYDKYIKLWDTETGQCISRHSTGVLPFCARMHPDPASESTVLVGQQNRLIVQWDLRSNTVVQEYNEHLSAVNTVTFIDDNKRFVSTSDDKKVFIWDLGVPIVIKQIAEPDMHSIPAVTVTPNGKYFLGQSQDNQILVFTAQNKYRLRRQKRFVGHSNAGYACQMAVSSDGQFLISGDGKGDVYIWDFSSTRIISKFHAHDQVCIDVQWNGLETSKLATCSWDGSIKYWD